MRDGSVIIVDGLSNKENNLIFLILCIFLLMATLYHAMQVNKIKLELTNDKKQKHVLDSNFTMEDKHLDYFNTKRKERERDLKFHKWGLIITLSTIVFLSPIFMFRLNTPISDNIHHQIEQKNITLVVNE